MGRSGKEGREYHDGDNCRFQSQSTFHQRHQMGLIPYDLINFYLFYSKYGNRKVKYMFGPKTKKNKMDAIRE